MTDPNIISINISTDSSEGEADQTPTKNQLRRKRRRQNLYKKLDGKDAEIKRLRKIAKLYTVEKKENEILKKKNENLKCELDEKTSEIDSLRSALKLRNNPKNKNFDTEFEAEIQEAMDEVDSLLNQDSTKVQVSPKNDKSTEKMTEEPTSGPTPETVVINQCEKGPKESKPIP